MSFRGKVRELIGMPPILLIVEVFMAIAILRNLNMFGVASFILIGDHDLGEYLRYGGMIALAAMSSVFAVNTMFGLPSSNRYSWRSTMRTTVFLVISNLIYEYSGETYMNISSIEQLLFLSAVSMIIMMLPAIRAYYVPPMHDLPPITWWLKFCLLKPNDRHHRYEFSENNSAPAVETIVETGE